MEKIKPIYWKLLIAAAIVYVIFTSFMLSDIYLKIGDIEHKLAHVDAASH